MVPGQAEPPGHRRHRRVLEPADREGLEGRREARSRITPGDMHLLHAVLVAPDPRHLSDDRRAVLARVQVPPTALAPIMDARSRLAHRARQTPTRLRFDVHLDLLDVVEHVDPVDRPWGLQSEDALEQLSVLHTREDSAPNLTLPEASGCYASTRNPEAPESASSSAPLPPALLRAWVERAKGLELPTFRKAVGSNRRTSDPPGIR